MANKKIVGFMHNVLDCRKSIGHKATKKIIFIIN